ncbi:MAG: DNA primase [Treponema sp.]|nr:DNA primase [Treponema sp.]
MSRIAQSSIQEVLDRIDAVAVVEDHIRLEKRGGRYWGRCPFHAGGQEKTPSFTVDPDKKLYYCFGCHKGGGMVDFVMEMDKSAYPETIKNLARKFGVELTYDGSGEEAQGDWEAEQSHKEQLFELYRRTALSFSHFLLEKPEGKPALDYLVSRGMTAGIIKYFRLGYSPVDRDWLYRFLLSKGYSGEFLDISGLFSSNYKGKSFFTDRLMFPIADRQGRVVAFGGRALPSALPGAGTAHGDGAVPKYINTRETGIYKKGQILYALDLALPEIRRSKTVYIAEGYVDVIALHQAGITNAVAPCGTAFTDEQARLLRHWADAAVLVFDSDEAGRNAVIKGIITCRKNGLACSVAAPGKDGGAGEFDPSELKDPADILLKFGAGVLNESMKCVIMDSDYYFARGKALYDIAVPQGKASAIATLYPYFDVLGSETERNACIEAAADEMRADRAAVLDDYERWRRTGGNASKKNLEEVSQTETAIRMNDELFLLTVVSVNTQLYPEFRAAIEIREIEDPFAKEIFVALEEGYRNEENSSDALMSNITSPALRNFIIERGISPEFRGNPRKLMEDGIKRIRGKKLRRRLSEIGEELRLKERNSGGEAGEDFQELIIEKMHIDAEIQKLEGKTG